MSGRDVVETIYGRYSKFEIVRKTSLFGSPRFYVLKDGKAFRGPFVHLSSAVASLEKER